MKAPLLVLLYLFAALPLAAQAPEKSPAPQPTPPDLVTLTGQTYRAARVGRVEPDGITYFFSGGVVKIPFNELPEAIRKQYGYDPRKAAEFARAEAEAQAETANRPAPAAARAASAKVWVNTDTGVYHMPGTRLYGKTKHGKFVTEDEAIKEGDRLAR